MEHQRSPLLTWAYYCQGKSIDELRQSFLLTTLELETERARAQEELLMRDDELNHLRNLLSLTMRERDDAQQKCHKLVFEKLLLQQQLTQFPPIQSNQTAPLSATSSIEDEPLKEVNFTTTTNKNNDFSSESDESALSEDFDPLVGDKPLPEQGQLLQAVMKAGPLLQTLLLAGPLPQWRHPPIHSYHIPPPPLVVPPPVFSENCGGINRKRDCTNFEGSDVCPNETKYPRVTLH